MLDGVTHPFPDTPLTRDGDTLRGPVRAPAQMLADQEYDGHASVHDDAEAAKLGLAGAPIEGPTHFSQFDPLAHALFGDRWFAEGCISAHFQTMVVEGESVVAAATRVGDELARIDAAKSADSPDDSSDGMTDDTSGGTPVLTGTISVGDDAATELDERLARMRQRDVGELFIVDRVEVGARSSLDHAVSVDATTPNGHLYPFSLAQKLDKITEPSAWYSTDDNPWGRPILPFEMYSVLTHQAGASLPVRGPAVGLFIDLQVRAVDGPLFVGEDYLLEREVLAVGQSRQVESHWVETVVRRASDGEVAARVLLHSGVFKASYADYPADRL